MSFNRPLVKAIGIFVKIKLVLCYKQLYKWTCRGDRQQGEQKKRQPMTINDRGRNLAQAGRALHAPAEARRAFRDLAKSGGSEAAGVLARSTGRGPRSI